jgi:hypothetical protein
LALIPSRPHRLVPISFGEFSPLDDPKAKREKIGDFRVFLVLIKQKKKRRRRFFGGKTRKTKTRKCWNFLCFLV